jgi:hypothetical protein
MPLVPAVPAARLPAPGEGEDDRHQMGTPDDIHGRQSRDACGAEQLPRLPGLDLRHDGSRC